VLVDRAAGGSWGCSTKKVLAPPFGNLSFTICQTDGQTGGGGDPGEHGTTGAGGDSIEMRAQAAAGSSLLMVVGNGQKGGRGQKGGTGGTGGRSLDGQNRAGDVVCGNQNSRLDGSKGGPDGPGGAGSTVLLSKGLAPAAAEMSIEDADAMIQAIVERAALPVTAFPILAVSVGGHGGDGGEGGSPGAGVPGGAAGKGSHCGGGGNPGKPGGHGGKGGDGPDGAPGAAGKVEVE